MMQVRFRPTTSYKLTNCELNPKAVRFGILIFSNPDLEKHRG